jgi:hydrogenase maturation protease
LKETNLAAFHPGSGSAHGWGVAETLALGRRLNPEWLPQNMVLIGIEGQDFSPGLCLSAPVQKALDQAVNIVDEWVKIYLGDKI